MKFHKFFLVRNVLIIKRFAINNPLLQTPETFIQSEKLKNMRKEMAEILKKIIMTANEKRKMLTEKMDNKKKDSNENKNESINFKFLLTTNFNFL